MKRIWPHRKNTTQKEEHQQQKGSFLESWTQCQPKEMKVISGFLCRQFCDFLMVVLKSLGKFFLCCNADGINRARS